jgi:RNA-directed DNA polymerase
MKESYGEGLAGHTGPKSCVCTRKGAGEALTGVHAGPVLSCEIVAPPQGGLLRGADVFEDNGRPHRQRRPGKALSDPAQSLTRCMHGNTLRGNREIPRSSVAEEATERIGKSQDVRR